MNKKRMEKNNKYLKKCEDRGVCFSPSSFESFGLAGREELDLVSSLVKKASECLNIDFALLLSQRKKRISTTLQVYTAKFILEASVSKRNPQRRQDFVDSALLCSSSAVINLVYMVLFIYYVLKVIKSFIIRLNKNG